MNLSANRVLVTGAGGFIGSHLTELLVRAGVPVRAMVHYNGRADWGQISLLPNDVQRAIDVILGDVRDRSAVRQAVEGCDMVFHLAALIGIPYSYSAPQSYVETNITGTLNILEACRDLGVKRLIQTSTSEVYGTAQYTPIDECHPLHAQSPYAATKVGSDQLAYSYYAAFGLPVVIVRPFNTFGPRQSTRAVIPTIITQGLASNEIQLGSTTPVRDFLYVRDTARGFIAAAAAPADRVVGEVLNIGTGQGVTIGQVVEMVGKILNKSLQVATASSRQRPEKSEVMALICSADKIAERAGWRAETSLEAGLAETVEWIDQNRHRYRAGSYTV